VATGKDDCRHDARSPDAIENPRAERFGSTLRLLVPIAKRLHTTNVLTRRSRFDRLSFLRHIRFAANSAMYPLGPHALSNADSTTRDPLSA